MTLQHLAWTAGLILVFGVGAVGTHGAQWAWARYAHSRTGVQVDATAQTLRRLEDEVSRLKSSVDTLRTAADTRQDDSLRTLKHSVETLKSDLQQARAADGTSLQQIAAKLDKADHDPTPKLAEIAARLDRIEHEPKPADPQPVKLADLASRLDRIERQVAAPATTGSIPQPARPAAAAVTTVSRTVSPASAKPDESAAAKPTASASPKVDAWVVRDVYDGTALVEARRGGLREVQPGEFLPGAGQVRSIERRGRAWVVLTSRGVIEPNTF